ncbi:MAG: hypothetical protein IKJ99_09755 [Oscillospiraceae bacterium]|nr:hypothetical protein [Oscillospiraceae bacterium]
MNACRPALPVSGKFLYKKKVSLPEVPCGMVPATIRACCAPFDPEVYGDGAHTLYVLPEASAELDHWVRFGKKRASNIYEQQFIGLGHEFIDTNRRIQTVITRIIPIFSAGRGPAYAKVISEGNDSILDVIANERKIQNELENEYNTDENGYTVDPFLGYGPSGVVLFGHTHPDIGCFFSSTDHRSNYSTPSTPIVTFVTDPIRKEMKAMVGMGCEDMKVIVCRPQTVAPAPFVEVQPVPPEVRPVPLEYTVEELWQRVSAASNILLQQPGVSGNFDSHHDWRGRTHMQFRITYRPLRRPPRE